MPFIRNGAIGEFGPEEPLSWFEMIEARDGKGSSISSDSHLDFGPKRFVEVDIAEVERRVAKEMAYVLLYSTPPSTVQKFIENNHGRKS